MSYVTEKEILHALENVQHGDSDIVSKGAVSKVAIDGGRVGFSLDVVRLRGADMNGIRELCMNYVQKLDGVEKVTVVLTAEKVAKVEQGSQASQSAKPIFSPEPLGEIKHVIAVASGKGGVGKSTVAVNLALAFAKMGKRVGLLDADVYGPSIAHMMGIKEKPESDGGAMIPPENLGIKFMSMGLLLDEDAPVVWRGPMLAKALHQMTYGTQWGKLDILIIDMPPGTGDVQISLAQKIKLSGAVIVSTPQKVALLDVRKAVTMFRKMQIPVLGIVSNMSYIEDSGNGSRNYIFGEGNIDSFAEAAGIEYLAEIPLEPSIAEKCDTGGSALSSGNENYIDTIFVDIAEKISAEIAAEEG